MNEALGGRKGRSENPHPQNREERILLYPGIELSYLTFAANSAPVQSPGPEHILQINYCRAGQAAWRTNLGKYIFLNPGDFSLHTVKSCADSAMMFPTGHYQGLAISVDLQAAAACPPDLLNGTGLFPDMLRQKFCWDNTATFFARNEQTEPIFSAFYHQPAYLRLAYQRIKVLELLLYLAGMEIAPRRQLVEYQTEQINTVRNIHDQLLQHMDQRITIEELSRRYLINTTTLKAAFKSVYGTSIAAHIKEHRMGQAAKLLRESNLSIAEIAQAVGYDSPSKFSTAFKSFYQILPKDYRKMP